MLYTKAKEKSGTQWGLTEFMILYGNLSIIGERCTGILSAKFSNNGKEIYTHIEKKIRKTPVSEILRNQNEYAVIVLDICNEYCLYNKSDYIDYHTIWKDLHPNETEDSYFDVDDYYCDNSDIFDGEVI